MIRYDPEKHHRRSLRLAAYDYSQPGAYFVTVCVQDHACLLGEIVGGQMQLNDAGKMVRATWEALPQRFEFVRLDQFEVMPNHFHGILLLSQEGHAGSLKDQGDHKDRPYEDVPSAEIRRGEPCVRPVPQRGTSPTGTPTNSLGRIVQAFKSITTHEYILGVKRDGWTAFPGALWQRNYYEHIVRDDDELARIRQYIADNPARWEEDLENPARVTLHPSTLGENCRGGPVWPPRDAARTEGAHTRAPLHSRPPGQFTPNVSARKP